MLFLNTKGDSVVLLLTTEQGRVKFRYYLIIILFFVSIITVMIYNLGIEIINLLVVYNM